jgi:hypothetical protein
MITSVIVLVWAARGRVTVRSATAQRITENDDDGFISRAGSREFEMWVEYEAVGQPLLVARSATPLARPVM